MGNRDDWRQGGVDDAAEDGGLGETALPAREKRAKRVLGFEGGGVERQLRTQHAAFCRAPRRFS